MKKKCPRFGDSKKSKQRTFRVNDQNLEFCSNTINTCKYRIYSFLIVSIGQQFKRVANIYFLVISVLMLIGTYFPKVFQSPLTPFSTFGPLCLVLFLTTCKEGIEDLKRYKADKKENNRLCNVLENGRIQRIHWKDLKVGQIVKLIGECQVPADMVILSSSEDGQCYVETSNIDGETNLKIKQAIAAPINPSEIHKLGGHVACELPNPHIHSFTGTGYFEYITNSIPFNSKNFLLRGCTMRNNHWTFGMVVFTGRDTKVMQDNSGSRSKMSKIEKTVNKCIRIIFLAQIILCTVSTNLKEVWERFFSEKNLWYIERNADETYAWMPTQVADWLTFLVLYNNFIPISLYVTMEAVHFVQAILINNDQEMYDKESDTPAVARTSNINEDLGQISYVFSDKTGTLTQNVMKFQMCSIGGQLYGSASDGAVPSQFAKAYPGSEFTDSRLLSDLRTNDSGNAYQILEFMRVLSTCHTVIPETNDKGEIEFQAESPDENALVLAANGLGFELVNRSMDTVTVCRQGKPETFRVLAINEFNSTRKRMSMVVRTPEGRVMLYCKGADNVMTERSDGSHNAQTLNDHLSFFAQKGLRTLVIGCRCLSESESSSFLSAYKQAACAVNGREEQLMAVAEKIEKGMTIVGATAIEDKLQDGVAHCINDLHRAGIKVWVLTGDKVETAVNIGHSCGLLRPSMKIIKVISHDKEVVTKQLRDLLSAFGLLNNKSLLVKVWKQFVRITKKTMGKNTQPQFQSKDLALVINEKALLHILRRKQLEGYLLKLARLCSAVLACRVSPQQKCGIVKMVKNGIDPSPLTLAIGDGANDVAMIQEADVGVGISGKEGLQAVNSSDFAIAQFRFLRRLLLVHGRWDYRRMSKVVLYSFSKNVVITFVLFGYCLLNGISGTSFFESVVYSGFNFFLGLPIFILGIMDRDLSSKTSLTHPGTYLSGRLGQSLNMRKMIEWVICAIIYAFVIFSVSIGSITWEYSADGRTDGMMVGGTICYSGMILALTLKVSLETDTWTWVNFTAVFGSIISYFGFLMIYSDMFWYAPEMYGVFERLSSEPTAWAIIVIIPVATFVLDLCFEHVRTQTMPTAIDICREIDRKKCAVPTCWGDELELQTIGGDPASRRNTEASIGPETRGDLYTRSASLVQPRSAPDAPLMAPVTVPTKVGQDGRRIFKAPNRGVVRTNTHRFMRENQEGTFMLTREALDQIVSGLDPRSRRQLGIVHDSDRSAFDFDIARDDHPNGNGSTSIGFSPHKKRRFSSSFAEIANNNNNSNKNENSGIPEFRSTSVDVTNPLTSMNRF
eukprot:TRINITY_DN50_c0_g6_i1.p1 TRINITY_DN50_c0_g6~~TRINITY_DN50_c0_g6_i1.p1  ORF type:complete len:1300 (-),score=360.94 TRINITY_DN50_c0_g6_i1:211-4110(-)